MGRTKMPGLYKRGGIWHIDKQVQGRRLQESTGSSDLDEAERYLIHRLEEIRQASVYGVRPTRTFREAATKYLNEADKRSLAKDAEMLKALDPFIGDLPLDKVHIGTLQPFIESRRKDGVKSRTINYPLQVVRHILNLAAGEWLDEYGLTWLATAPKIKLLPEKDKREPYPLSWEEQGALFSELPLHLRRLALFLVNTGVRDTEACSLRWDWEVHVPELATSVFIVPDHYIKNSEARLVVLNHIAKSVIEEVRGENPDYVFTFNGKPILRVNNTAWKKARKRAGLPDVRVHDLKHTYGRRLRAADVSFENRQDLLVETYYHALFAG